MAQGEVALQIGPPKIQVPVQQPQLLARQLLPLGAPYGDRQRLQCGRADDLELVCVHLYLAGRHIGIQGFRRPGGDLSAHQDHGLGRHRRRLLDDLRRTPVRSECDLHDPVAVAQIQEDQPAEIAPAVDPAAELHARADMGRAESTAAVCAHGSGGHWSLSLDGVRRARDAVGRRWVAGTAWARSRMRGGWAARLRPSVDGNAGRCWYRQVARSPRRRGRPSTVAD
jgi:hypothetical protein